MISSNIITVSFQSLLCISLIGCAAEVKRQPETLRSAIEETNAERRAITADVRFTLDSGYERVLRKDTIWRLVGTLAQGNVYASSDSVFSIEGAHVHEAYLVVNSGKLVGFYLPVERSFAPLNSTSNINLWEK